jgi:hypothetical protein
MGYSVVADVTARLHRTFSGTTTPTTTEVEGFITQYYGKINAVLRHHGFTPPVTDADGFLKTLEAAGVAYQTAEAIYTGEGFNNADNRIERLWREWTEGIEMLRKTPNMIQNTASVTVADVVTVPDSTYAESAPARFTMDTDY